MTARNTRPVGTHPGSTQADDVHPADANLAAGLRVAGSLIEPPGHLDPARIAATAVRNVRRSRVVTATAAGIAALVLVGAGIGVLGSTLTDQRAPLPGDEVTAPAPSVRPSEQVGGALEYPTLEPLEHGVPAGWTQVEHDGLSFAVPEGWTSRPTEGEFGPGVEWTGPTVIHVNGGAGTSEEEPQLERVYVQSGKPGENWWARTASAPESQLIDVPGTDYAEAQPDLATMGGEPVFYGASLFLHQAGQGENLFLVVEFDGGPKGWADLHAFLGSLDFRR
ncbi:hypothetical protein [Promicromonospora sukumoe]|uniref:hypothetical protein n=1 Tax=Promicromonospora sukumoe TaxID=88382 RepID=UPI003668B313